MKRKLLFLVTLILIFVTVGCSKSVSVDTESNLEIYEDNFVKFDYNPDVITNMQLDTDEMDYFLVSKLLDDTITNPTSLLDLTGTAIIVSDTDESLYRAYQADYAVAFTTFINGMLDINEISKSDVTGKPSTMVECDKVLSNGNIVKAKFLSISKDKLCIVYCHIPKTIDESDKNEILRGYDSIEYKNPNIIDKVYTDDYISMKYNTNLLEVNKFAESDSSYLLVVRQNTSEFDTSNLFANSIIEVVALPVTSDFGNMYINNPELCATIFNGALSTDEIEPSDITNGRCEKILSDGRAIKVKFLNDVNKKNIIAIYSVTANEEDGVIKEFEKTYESINN